jgi:hypothetical protein
VKLEDDVHCLILSAFQTEHVAES